MTATGPLPLYPVEAAVDGIPVEGWVWVSFADPDLPEGQQFLGVVVTEKARWPMLGLFGLNPGGEMAVADIPEEHLPPPEFRNRILTREEAESL